MSMKLKKRMIALGLLLIAISACFYLICLSACQLNKENSVDNFKMAIWTSDKIAVFNDYDLNEFNGNIARKEKYIYWAESFSEAGSYSTAKTKDTPNLKRYVSRINKENLSEKFKVAEGNDAYASITDGDYLYATAVFTDRIEFYKYDNNLEVVTNVTVKNDGQLNASQQFVIVDNYLYLLVTTLDLSTQVPNVEIWKMDKEFNIVEKYNLDETSAYMRMVNVDDVLYIVEALSGRNSNGEYQSGNKLLVFDLKSQNKNYIDIPDKYPTNIHYDLKNNQLIIENDGLNNGEFSFTTVNLDNLEKDIIHLEGFSTENYTSPYFTFKDNFYYFLFNDSLVKYNIANKNQTVINLENYKIKDAHYLIVR